MFFKNLNYKKGKINCTHESGWMRAHTCDTPKEWLPRHRDTAVWRNTLQHTATHCNALAIHCNAHAQLQHEHARARASYLWYSNRAAFPPSWQGCLSQHAATHCNTLQHTCTAATQTRVRLSITPVILQKSGFLAIVTRPFFLESNIMRPTGNSWCIFMPSSRWIGAISRRSQTMMVLWVSILINCPAPNTSWRAAHTYTRTHTRTRTDTLAHARTHTHTHARTRERTRTRTCTHAHAHARTHVHAHVHTHTQYIVSWSRKYSLILIMVFTEPSYTIVHPRKYSLVLMKINWQYAVGVCVHVRAKYSLIMIIVFTEPSYTIVTR